jgi:hypothetical protein
MLRGTSASNRSLSNPITDLGFFMHGRLLASAVAAVVFGFAGMANAANVTAINPQSIVQALQNGGYKAVLSKTDDGDPIIETASDGNAVMIVMTDCENHKSCTTAEFVGVWDCSDSVEKCKQAVLSFNSKESPVHVIMSDDGKTATTYSYLLCDEVGISEALLIKNLVTFTYYNTQFTLEVAKK